MDRLDRAQKLEEQHRSNAIMKRKRYAGTSAHECSECGEAIPEARRQALPGVTTCVECQSINEHIQRTQDNE